MRAPPALHILCNPRSLHHGTLDEGDKYCGIHRFQLLQLEATSLRMQTSIVFGRIKRRPGPNPRARSSTSYLPQGTACLEERLLLSGTAPAVSRTTGCVCPERDPADRRMAGDRGDPRWRVAETGQERVRTADRLGVRAPWLCRGCAGLSPVLARKPDVAEKPRGPPDRYALGQA